MDQNERDEILYRLDERTKKVDDHLERLDQRVAENEERIDELTTTVNKNSGNIKVAKRALAVLASAATAIAARVFAGLRVL